MRYKHQISNKRYFQKTKEKYKHEGQPPKTQTKNIIKNKMKIQT